MNELEQTEMMRVVPAVSLATESEQVMDLFRRAFEGGGATPEALAQLVALREQVSRRNAELEFAQAMVAFQTACPPIPKSSRAKITTKSGTNFEYSFADFEQIVETVRPHLHALGLSFTFDSRTDGKMLTCTCHLRHANGHAVESNFTLPTDSSSAMSEQQKVGSALTFAKRMTLVSVLGLSVTDVDPENDADPEKISAEQVANLNALMDETGADRARFLVYLRVGDLAELRARDYKMAVAALEAKRPR